MQSARGLSKGLKPYVRGCKDCYSASLNELHLVRLQADIALFFSSKAAEESKTSQLHL